MRLKVLCLINGLSSLQLIFLSHHFIIYPNQASQPKHFLVVCELDYWNGEHGVVVRAFDLYWGGIRFESLSTHHCCSLSKSFIPSLVVWSMTKNNAFGGEKQNKEATVSSQ